MECMDCGKTIESTTGAAFEISGWERERHAGGTNHVLWRTRTGRVLCRICVIKRTYEQAHDPNQLVIA